MGLAAVWEDGLYMYVAAMGGRQQCGIGRYTRLAGMGEWQNNVGWIHLFQCLEGWNQAFGSSWSHSRSKTVSGAPEVSTET